MDEYVEFECPYCGRINDCLVDESGGTVYCDDCDEVVGEINK